MNQTKRKVLSGVLAVALLLQTVLPTTVFAAESAPKTIVGFSALEKNEYTLPIGADEAAVNALLETLPKTITAKVEYIVTEELPPVVDSGKPETLPEQPETPPVTEETPAPDETPEPPIEDSEQPSEPAEDEDTADEPQQGDIATGSDATAKDEDSEDVPVRAFGMSSMETGNLLETTLVEEVVSEEVELAVTWKPGKELSTEEAGEFTYTATLTDTDKGRYDLAPGVSLPEITVTVGMNRMLLSGTIKPRTIKLDLTSNTVTYQTADGTATANPTTGNIIDTAEGWSWNFTTKTLTLNGANIAGFDENSLTYGIWLPKDATIQLAEGSVNTVTAGAGTDDDSIGIFSKGAITIGGAGTLEVTGSMTTRNSYGIYACGAIIISGGTVNTTGGTECKSSYGIYGEVTVTISGGTVTATGGTVTATAGISRGISARGAITISGGTVNATGSEAEDSCGIAAEGTVTISGTSNVTATGGTATDSVTVNTSRGIYTGDAIAISGGTVNATGGTATGQWSTSYGIYTIKDVTFSGGKTTAKAATSAVSSIRGHITLDTTPKMGITVPIGGKVTAAGDKIAGPDGTTIAIEAVIEKAYTLTLSDTGDNASGAGEYAANQAVTINAGTKSGHTFKEWTSSDVTLPTPISASITFTMPAKDVTVTASWTENITVTGVSVTPATVTVSRGNTQQFSAAVTGTAGPAQTVNWTVSGGKSSISSGGLLTVSPSETAQTLTVTATATADTTKSGTATVTVPAMPKVQVPTASPIAGSFVGSIWVTLTSGTADAEIYYTTDGSTPNTGSTKYTAEFELTQTTTVKAIAVKAGMTDSDVASVTFIKNNALGELNILDGSIEITATGYKINDGIETPHTGNYTITGDSTATANTIKVTGSTHNITLNNVNIQATADDTCAFAIEGGTVNLTLAGSNTLSSGKNKAGLQVETGKTLVITAANTGSLTATGGQNGAGIGGSGGTVTIIGGTVTATGGISGQGISGTFSTGTNGTAMILASSISDKSYQTNTSTGGIILDEKKGAVYGLQTLRSNWTIAADEALTIERGNSLTIPEGITLRNDGKIVNGGTIIGTVVGNQPIKMGELNIADGLIKITSTGYTVGDGDELPYTGDYTIIGSYTTTSNDSDRTIVTVNGGTHNITLNGVNIDASLGDPHTQGNGAFAITGNAKVDLTLSGSNTLKSGTRKAGLQVVKGSSVTISGTDTDSLTASGTAGAGIGGGYGDSGSSITITGGTINATGSDGGAGIGGGHMGGGGTITITGGRINTTGSDGGAGIGGGTDGDSGTFSTGSGGNAFIKTVSIADQTYKTAAGTQGIIFEGASGTVYGSYTLSEDTTLAANETLTVKSGATLTVPTGVTLTNNGTLTANGTLNGDGNFRINFKPENIALNGGGSYTYTGVVIDPNPTVENKTIGGKVFTVDTSGYNLTPTFVKKGSDSAWVAVDASAIKDAGTYKVVYTKTADSTATVEKSFNITKSASALGLTTNKADNTFTYGETITFTATMSIPAAKGRAATVDTVDFYYGTTKLNTSAITLTESGGTGTVTFTYDTKGKGIPTGTQSIRAEYGGSGNMNGVTQTISVTLNKKALTATVTAGATKVYDGGAAFSNVALTLTGAESGDTVTATANGTAASADVGIRAFTATAVTLGGTSKDYYSVAKSAVSGNVSITTKTVTGPVITLAQTSVVYDGTAKTPAVSSVKDGTTTIPAGEYTVSYSSNTNAGTATVTITDVAGGNYTISGSTTFEITKAAQATLTITGKPATVVYGDSFTPGTSGGSGGGAVTWAVTSGDSFATVNSSTGAVSIIGVGSVTITATKAGDSGYEAATATVTFTVAKADQAAFAIDAVTGKKYNDAAFALATTGGSGSGAVSFSVPASNGVLSISGSNATIVGAGTVTVTATKAADNHYNVKTTTLSITIGKAAAPTITYPTAASLTYGQKLSNSALTGGSTTYGSFAWTDSNTVPTVTNTGYGVTFTPSADTLKNYEAINNLTGTVAVTVSKGTPVINVTAAISGDVDSRQAALTATITKVGDGDVPSGTVKFVNSTTGTDVDIFGATAVSITNGVATYTWTGLAEQIYKVKAVYSGNDNYGAATASEISFDTRKQNQENFAITAIGAKTYGDISFTLSTTGGNGTGAVTFESSDSDIISISGTTATIHKVGNVSITAKKAADSSYNEATASVAVSVVKKAVTVKADDKLNIIKGSTMPPLTYTATGLAGSDSFTTAPTMTTIASDTNTVGEYPITVSGGVLSGGDNYVITYTNGKLTIIEQLYSVTLTSGGSGATGGGSYAPGTTVSLNAGSKSGYSFSSWTASPAVTFANAASATTSFVMPSGNVTVTANWSYNGGGSGGGSSSGGIITTPPATAQNPNPPTQTTTTVQPTISGDTATVTVPEASVKDAITKAQAEAKKNGKTDNGISVEIKADTKNATNLTVNLPKASIDALVSAGVKETKTTSGAATISLSLDALKEIQRQTCSDVTVTAAKAANSTLSNEAKALIGNRPVYDLSITGKNGAKVTSFGNGTVSVVIPYTLGANETAGNVVAYYIDGNGKATEMPNSVYNTETKTLSFITSHFSMYAVGYKEKTVTFTDITNHWAKESIEFVAARGLLAGTGESTFSPNTSMTRGMFVTALGRLAGADVSSYKQSSFTDVTVDAYYLGYIEWAVKNNIVQGMGSGKFAPDQAISREQMAVIMQNYAKAIGFDLPRVHAQNTFADNAKISGYASDAVKVMQMAGVLAGKNGNQFDPQGTATRAEVSAVLKRFVELAISTDSAQGWMLNDSGKWMFYENGRPVTGTKNIGGASYTFDANGETADLPKNLTYGSYTVQSSDS